MELDIHGKQVDVGDALRTHVSDKLADINQKYFNHATSAKVTFTKEGHGHGLFKVTISYLVGKNIMVNTESEAGDPYGAFDQAADKAAKRLRRYKKRLRDHYERGEKTPEAENLKARDYILALDGSREEAEEQDNEGDTMLGGDDPVVIAEMTTNIQKMSVSEAVMLLDLSGQPALLFRNAKHDGLNMVYKRNDGNIGWIDPGEQSEKAA